MRLGKQALADGAFESDNMLGDVVEALIGALWLDAGLEAARAFIRAAWADRVDSRDNAPKHPKSALQEWAAANDRKPPAYALVGRSGPHHAPTFVVEVSIKGVGEASAEGLDQAGGGDRGRARPCWRSWHEPALRHRRRRRRAQCGQIDPGQCAGRPEGRHRHRPRRRPRAPG